MLQEAPAPAVNYRRSQRKLWFPLALFIGVPTACSGTVSATLAAR
jgi:hypothetical protein